eukprot:gene20455-biopygen6737
MARPSKVQVTSASCQRQYLILSDAAQITIPRVRPRPVPQRISCSVSVELNIPTKDVRKGTLARGNTLVLSFLRPATEHPSVELRVEVHHLREAKMVYVNSQFDPSCLGALWQTVEMVLWGALSEGCQVAPRKLN